VKTHLYVRDEDGKTDKLCSVNLEVVPGGTYVVDGIPYTLVEKPTFVIANGELQFVNLIVERVTEFPIAQRR